MRRDEAGAGAVSGLLWLGILVVIAMACVLTVAVVTTHRRSQAAADLAALAGAQARQRGEEPCRAAARNARRNAATLSRCRLHGDQVSVTVSVSAPELLGQDRVLRARARAGPVGSAGLTALAPGDLG